ncbi:MAG: DUF2851 family protein [Bacteroidota bacterium]|nr:DUF2851 family protein [Bacteroidota bacterium]
MTEKLLHFIWRFQYYNTVGLQTTNGENVRILKPGTLNQHQGPDFINASIVMNNIIIVGSIELHLLSSDWDKHRHSTDTNYGNIILHVVWKHDMDIKDVHGVVLPVIELQNLVPNVLLEKYRQLMEIHEPIACARHLPVLSQVSWIAWKERLAVERLEEKASKVLQLLKQNNNHWEETFWQMLAYSFGIKVNAAFFEQVARSIPINVLAKHKNQIHQVEALLLGQANLLDNAFTEKYPLLLQREYHFLQKKYGLRKVNGSAFFLRMRPANFPTIRLAQLAMLIHRSSHLFSHIRELLTIQQVEELLLVTANDYWNTHFTFHEETPLQLKTVGKQFINTLCINTIVPVVFAYGVYNDSQTAKDKSLQWLSALQAEKNNVTQRWMSFQVSNSNAMESQALLHLQHQYCLYKKCLQCAVGNKLLAAKES